MRNPLQFTVDLFEAADDWPDYVVIVVMYAIPIVLLHGIVNASAVFVANGGPTGAYSNVDVWEVVFRTGFYPYDVLMWALTGLFMFATAFLAFAALLGAFFAVIVGVLKSAKRFSELKDRAQ